MPDNPAPSTKVKTKLESMYRMTRELHLITYFLRLLGFPVLIASLANLAVLVIAVINGISVQQYNQINSNAIANFERSAKYFSSQWLEINLAVLILALILLAISDTLRRRGDALFQEISNAYQELELEADLSSPFFQEEIEAGSTRARTELRSFSTAADLPLIRGRYGAAIYAAVNVIIVIVAVILYTQFA
jgi:hypothetical protein